MSSRDRRFVQAANDPGVNVTGALLLDKTGPPLVFKGVLFVRGSTAAHGVLQLSGRSLHGKLGRRRVGG